MYSIYILSFIPSWMIYKGLYGLFHSQAYISPLNFECFGRYNLCLVDGVELKLFSLVFLGFGIYMYYRIVKGASSIELGKVKSNEEQKKVLIKHAVIGLIAMIIVLPLIIYMNIDSPW